MNKSIISPPNVLPDAKSACLHLSLHASARSLFVCFFLHPFSESFQFALNINQNVTFIFSVYLLKTLFTILVYSAYCLGKGLSKQLQLRQRRPHLKSFKAPGLSSQPFLRRSYGIKRGPSPNKTGLCSFNHTL